MKITNPATGSVLIEVFADNVKAVREKYERARAAQPSRGVQRERRARPQHPVRATGRWRQSVMGSSRGP